MPAERAGEGESPADVSRLRALLELMREFGVTRLALADGTVIERPPTSPLERALTTEKSPQARVADDPDDDQDDEDAAKRALERAWDEKWSRITAASGAAIPEFPGVEQARAFLGEH